MRGAKFYSLMTFSGLLHEMLGSTKTGDSKAWKVFSSSSSEDPSHLFKCLRLANLNGIYIYIYVGLQNGRYLSWTELRLKLCQSPAKWLISPTKAFPVRIMKR